MKKVLFLLALITAGGSIIAQKKTTSSAVISFDATTEKDKLPKAENKTVIGALDTMTGSVQFEAAVKNFSFSSPRMQEHFNRTEWLNSNEFPKFSFSGKITDLAKVNFLKDGTYTATVTGELSVKGIKKAISTPVKFVVTAGKINASASFSVKLSDYNISHMLVEAGKVAREPKVSVTASF